MEQICNDNDFSNVRYTGGLIDATSNSEEFSFCGHDVHSMVYGFNDGFVTDINVSNRDGDIVFDTSISNDESIGGIQRGDDCYFIQLAQLRCETIFTSLVRRIERETARENVNNTRTRRKFLVKWVKCRKYFVKSIVHINNRTFDHFLLMRNERI